MKFKFLLDQRLSTIPQHQWVSKLLGYDFTVEYRPRRQNTAVDALSRRDEEAVDLHAISAPQFTWFTELRQEIEATTSLTELR